MLLDVDMMLSREPDKPDKPGGQGAPSALRSDLLEIRRGLVLSSELTNKLLLFSQNATKKMEPLVVNGQIKEVGKMLSRLLGEHINAVLDLDQELWPIRGDAASIDQIVTNLAINSRDAMPDGGSLVIETRNVDLSEGTGQQPGARPGCFVRIAVRDTGHGFDEDTRAKMYDPFFTAKASSGNTGLGLSVVYGAVKAHGGWIEVESAPGKGARFDIYLPALEADGVADINVASLRPSAQTGYEQGNEQGNQKGYEPGREQILLLEDEGSLRDSIQRALEGKGYRVKPFADLATARPALNEAAFDLILSDVRLPDGSGTMLVAEALERDAGIATILMSGYATADPELERHMEAAFLKKPFALTELLSEVREQLDRSRQVSAGVV